MKRKTATIVKVDFKNEDGYLVHLVTRAKIDLKYLKK